MVFQKTLGAISVVEVLTVPECFVLELETNDLHVFRVVVFAPYSPATKRKNQHL